MVLVRVVLLFSCFVVLPCAAQNMSFAGGTLYVASGTTLTFNAPLTWQIAPDGIVVNDGLIDLDAQGSLIESDGQPITGAGVERARWPEALPLQDAHPGGLGLRITSDPANGDLEVQRGHQPVFAANGTPSIARWYRISTPAPSVSAMAVSFRYDLTELNGIQPSALALFEAPELAGTWTALATASDLPNQSLSATDQAPTDFITAFDLDAATSVPNEPEASGVRVWPTLVEDRINISSSVGDPIRTIELFDLSGRTIWRYQPSAIVERMTVALPSLASGSYTLLVNRQGPMHRLLKP